MTEASIIKDRPAQLRRRPRPAPDETVDPVDYTPSNPVPAPVAAPVRLESDAAPGGGVEPEPVPAATSAPVEDAPAAAAATEPAAPAEVAPVQEKLAPASSATEPAAAAEAAPVQEAPAPVRASAPTAPAPAKQSIRGSKSSKATNKKSSRREVTFPLSTRVSQDILDLLYDAQENEGVTLRDAIEQGIRMRWS
jgi:hypothetical protein